MDVPLTTAVLVLNVHDDVIASAASDAITLSVTPTPAIVDEASVASAVSVPIPVVSKPAMLALATVVGDVPGNVARPIGPAEIRPVACATNASLGDAAEAGMIATIDSAPASATTLGYPGDARNFTCH